jgi:hypothetical protein
VQRLGVLLAHLTQPCQPWELDFLVSRTRVHA